MVLKIDAKDLVSLNLKVPLFNKSRVENVIQGKASCYYGGKIFTTGKGCDHV